MHKNGERHLAGVVVVHAMCRCMPYQFLICEEDAMSSSMPMLNVMKTDIEGKRLTTNPRLHRWSSQTRRLQMRMLLRVIDDATLSHLLVPALLVRTRR
ncbi:hypothetical protein T4E_4720 [Trichinella pseudospiralis]|uniref:Uncharacterized protein n=1 Tax=Trichinella pseudospiralis TaxID=6337 RepID=A0A0V0XDZ7_TRIPS|nr:hypothetical protein T4E_185 [Trichinella pseudospiralis]KRX86260.1 hypothetical protein T4E_4720 [Trichinella pseudospiralis]